MLCLTLGHSFLERATVAIDNPLKALIGADAIGWLTDDSRQPARGLPSCAYTSEAMLTHEYLRVFAPSWI